MTTPQPFQPADGETARWRHCDTLVDGREARDQVTIQEVMELLDCDEQAAWSAMDQCRARREADGQRSFYTVPGFGWVIATASDMLRMTEKRERKTGRALGRAVRVLRATPRKELSQFEREHADRQMVQLTAHEDLVNRRRRIPLSQIGQQPEIG